MHSETTRYNTCFVNCCTSVGCQINAFARKIELYLDNSNMFELGTQAPNSSESAENILGDKILKVYY